MKTADKNIFNILLKKKIKTKKGKINFKDILCYLFNYLFIYLLNQANNMLFQIIILTIKLI